MVSQRDADRLRRIREGVFATQGLGHLSEYITTRTYLRGRLFSTAGYEYQQAILDDPSHDMTVGKSRQVGATECFIRLMLSLLATTQNCNGLLLLPHVKQALAMVKSRIDPIIQGSPDLRSQLVAGSDSSAFKMLGTSQLHTGGTYGEFISVPCDLRCADEFDYMEMANFATSDSALDNSAFVDPRTGQRGLRRTFGTPLTPRRGVHALYQHSDQKVRLVHAACGHSFHPHHDNVVVDGWDKPVIELTPADIVSLDARGLLPSAKIICPQCHATVPQSRLAPEYREWVAKVTNPNVTRSGYWVSPFDLPHDAFGRPKRTPEWLLRSRVTFGSSLAKYYNHTLGLAYADQTNSFLDQSIEENTVLAPFSPADALHQSVWPLIAGIDVGKPSYVAVGRPLPNDRMDVLYLAVVPLSGPNGEDLPTLIHDLLKPYRLQKLVIDAFPYSPSVLRLQALFPEQVVIACNYNLRDTHIQSVVEKPATQEASANRTRTLSALAAQMNKGAWRFPRMPRLMGESTNDAGTVRAHAANLTKINTSPDEDDAGEEWTGSPDHFMHAFNYLSIAAELVRQSLFSQGYVPLPAPRAVLPGSLVMKDDDAPRDPREYAREGIVLAAGDYRWAG